jgi:hypothetical protein
MQLNIVWKIRFIQQYFGTRMPREFPNLTMRVLNATVATV